MVTLIIRDLSDGKKHVSSYLLADNVTGLYKSRKSTSLKVLAFFRFDLNEKLTISQLVIEGNNDVVDNCDKEHGS